MRAMNIKLSLGAIILLLMFVASCTSPADKVVTPTTQLSTSTVDTTMPSQTIGQEVTLSGVLEFTHLDLAPDMPTPIPGLTFYSITEGTQRFILKFLPNVQ